MHTYIIRGASKMQGVVFICHGTFKREEKNPEREGKGSKKMCGV